MLKQSLLTISLYLLSVVTFAQAQEVPHYFRDFTFLETERLIIRKITLDDVQDLFEITSDYDVVKTIGAVTLHTSIEQTKEIIKDMIKHYEADRVEWWAVVEKTSQKMIGMCGFFGYAPNSSRAEVGYMIARSRWNKGYATEASQVVLAFGFGVMHLNRIHATVYPENSASIKVLEKLGMKYEGLLRSYMFCNNQFQDRKMYSILKNEWLEMITKR